MGGPPPVAHADLSDLDNVGQKGKTRGRLMTGFLVLSLAGVGGWAFMTHQSTQADEAQLAAIGAIQDQDEMLSQLRAYLGTVGTRELKQRTIRNLGHFRDPEAVPLLIEELQHAGPIRRDAAWALGQIGLPAAESAKAPLFGRAPPDR